MKIGVLGTGMVGKAIATKLVELGHEVRMGSRTSGNENAVAWATAADEGASEGAFPDAAEFGEVLFNCTAGGSSLDALAAAGQENLARQVADRRGQPARLLPRHATDAFCLQTPTALASRSRGPSRRRGW